MYQKAGKRPPNGTSMKIARRFASCVGVGGVSWRRGRHDGGVTEHYDVIIIGTGAGGGTLAHTLAPSGKRILLLERGDYLPREKDNWDPSSVFTAGLHI
jgi:hydrogenase maturation factor HypE